MAYQGVGTPRFYIDHVNYLKSLGTFVHSGSTTAEYRDSLYGLKSPSPSPRSAGGGGLALNSSIINDEINWAGVLGHNLNSLGIRWYIEGYDGSYISIGNKVSLVNSTFSQDDYNGFGITIASPSNNPDGFNFARTPEKFRFYFNSDANAGFTPTDNLQIGCLCYGKYYDMPHSPDLSLKMSIESDGVKTIQTKGGATLTNASYTKPADWGDRGAWQLGSTTNPNPPNLRNGRKTWDLSFSYLSDRDVFPANAIYVQSYPDAANSPQQMIDLGYHDDDINSTGGFETNILTGTDFFSQVWNKTAAAGNLPFIFQPNGNNNMPDNFAICRFDMKSLKVTQSMHRKYNVKLKIRECW